MSPSCISFATLILTLTLVASASEDDLEAETTYDITSDLADAVATTVDLAVATTVDLAVATTVDLAVTSLPVGSGNCDDVNCTTTGQDGKAVAVRPTRNVEPFPVNYYDTEDSSYSPPVYDLRVNPGLYACESTPQFEPFPPLGDPNQEYIIPAVRIGRCSGCNCGRLKSCQPSAMEPVIFQVEVKHYKKNRRGSLVTTLENITLYNHTACRCQCKQECAPPRVLKPDTCTCVCGQRGACPGNYLWNATRCACQCNVKSVPCPKPKVVDPDTCECRDRVESDGNRAQQKKRPTEVGSLNPLVARDDVISY